jgi:hypothetical protein
VFQVGLECGVCCGRILAVPIAALVPWLKNVASVVEVLGLRVVWKILRTGREPGKDLPTVSYKQLINKNKKYIIIIKGVDNFF